MEKVIFFFECDGQFFLLGKNKDRLHIYIFATDRQLRLSFLFYDGGEVRKVAARGKGA